MQNQTRAAEHRSKISRQRLGDFPELSKDQYLLLFFCHYLGNLPQASPLAAVLFPPGTIGQPLRGVIADLLEAHQEGQDQSASLDTGRGLDLFSQVMNRLFIQRSLSAAQ